MTTTSFPSPLAAAQGLWVRATIRVLPPASGPTKGATGDGAGPALRLAVLGESTAAGCGAASHDEGFTGHLARELATRGDRQIAWEVAAQHGATARRIRYRLLPRLGTSADIVVLLAGVNDVLSRRTATDWADDLAAILDDLTQRAEIVAVTGIPPFGAFPSLPRALRRYLANSARPLDEVARRLCANRPKTVWIDPAPLLPVITSDFFAADGFHPSSVGYQHWANSVADHLI